MRIGLTLVASLFGTCAVGATPSFDAVVRRPFMAAAPSVVAQAGSPLKKNEAVFKPLRNNEVASRKNEAVFKPLHSISPPQVLPPKLSPPVPNSFDSVVRRSPPTGGVPHVAAFSAGGKPFDSVVRRVKHNNNGPAIPKGVEAKKAVVNNSLPRPGPKHVSPTLRNPQKSLADSAPQQVAGAPAVGPLSGNSAMWALSGTHPVRAPEVVSTEGSTFDAVWAAMAALSPKESVLRLLNKDPLRQPRQARNSVAWALESDKEAAAKAATAVEKKSWFSLF